MLRLPAKGLGLGLLASPNKEQAIGEKQHCQGRQEFKVENP